MSTQVPQQDGRLYRQWTLWYLIPDRFTVKDAKWNDFLHKVCDFETVEEFWGAINSLERGAYLPKGCRYYVFKRGIIPLWEEPQNIGGTEVTIEHAIAKAKKQKINDRWEDVLCSVVGETIPNGNFINGVEITVRAETFRISLWVAPCGEDAIKEISAHLAKVAKWNSPVKTTAIKPAN